MSTKNLEVKGITLTPGKENLLALANIRIAGEYQVNGLRILKAKSGNVFVSMPGRAKTKEGQPVMKDGKQEYSDIFHGITKEAHDNIQSAVLAAFNAKCEATKAVENAQ